MWLMIKLLWFSIWIAIKFVRLKCESRFVVTIQLKLIFWIVIQKERFIWIANIITIQKFWLMITVMIHVNQIFTIHMIGSASLVRTKYSIKIFRWSWTPTSTISTKWRTSSKYWRPFLSDYLSCTVETSRKNGDIYKRGRCT